jgi:hypothetical protein
MNKIKKKIYNYLVNKILYFFIIDNFFRIVAFISVFLFKNIINKVSFFKNKTISIMQVDAFGDSLDQVMLIRLLNKFKKNILLEIEVKIKKLNDTLEVFVDEVLDKNKLRLKNSPQTKLLK